MHTISTSTWYRLLFYESLAFNNPFIRDVVATDLEKAQFFDSVTSLILIVRKLTVSNKFFLMFNKLLPPPGDRPS